MSQAQLSSALQTVLAKDALLVSDGNPTYRYFAQDAVISLDAINLSAGVYVKGAVHIQNVNAYHGRLKQWLHRFHCVATHYLDKYLGWFRCMDTHHANSPEGVLAIALGKFPHLKVT
jgi:hypothetical protein